MTDSGFTPMAVFGIGVICVIFVALGYSAYEQEMFKINSNEYCNQVIDKFDNKTIEVRYQNNIGTKMVYHGYDRCYSKATGNITRNTDLGYGSELGILLYGV